MSAAQAWALACRLFAWGAPVLRATLSAAEQYALDRLGRAVRSAVLDQRYALCPYCQAQRGQVWSEGCGGRVCHCPACGPVVLEAEDLAAVTLDEQWLMRGLRRALGIDSRDGIVSLADGVWRLGEARRAPVLLLRSLIRIWREPGLLERVQVPDAVLRVIAPKVGPTPVSPSGHHFEWLPLEERFTLYGGGIAHIPTRGSLEPALAHDPTVPVHGPFSQDFRWVTLPECPYGSIRCTDGQAAVFRALWSFKGEPMTAERIMQRAGLTSDKPIDLFKVKPRDQGTPEYEGPLFAYRTLVKTKRREGLYWMPCAAREPSR